MSLGRLLPACALTCASCTLIFNTDDLPPPLQIDAAVVDAAIDAPIDAPIDADPTQLALTSVTPTVVHEGMGTGGGRPVVLRIEADHLIDDAVVTLAWDPDDPANPVTPIETAINAESDEIAVALALPEIEAGFGETDPPRTLRVTVTQDGGTATASIPVMVRGHDRKVVMGTIDAAAADWDLETHSSIHVMGTTTVTGARRLRLAAYGSITIDAAINVTAPSAGGCTGAGPGGSANCGEGSGGAGANTTVNPAGGGGGGGFGTAGQGVSGSGGGTSGNPMLVPIDVVTGLDLNRGAGGGGGGNTVLAPMGGGTGGAGGGAVFLHAGGAIVVGAIGAINVNGAPGGTGSTGGAGGSGSGGAILVHAGAPIDYGQPAARAWLSARGANATGNGGRGGDGRVRVDDPGRNLTGAATPAAVAAPQFDLPVPVIVRTPTLALTARGPDGCFAVVPRPDGGNDACGVDTDRRLNPIGTPMTFTLAPGANKLCLGWAETLRYVPTQARPEAGNCVEVTYLP